MSVYAVTNPATGEQVQEFPTITGEELPPRFMDWQQWWNATGSGRFGQ